MSEPSHDSAGRSEGAPIAVSVVVPMFREAQRIGVTLDDLVPTMRGLGEPSELLLVDDGSDDDTCERVGPWLTESAVGSLERVRLIRHSINRGKGAAARTGLAAARGRWRLLMDADNACRASEMAKLKDEAGRTNAGLVVGSRRAAGAVVEAKLTRQLAGGIFRLCLRPLGLALASDTQCGFKLYRDDLARHIVRVGREDRFAFDLEHLLLARHGGFGIAEVGVVWAHVDGGTVRPIRDGIRMLARAVVIRWRHRGPAETAEPGPGLPSGEVEAKPTAPRAAADVERQRASEGAGV